MGFLNFTLLFFFFPLILICPFIILSFSFMFIVIPVRLWFSFFKFILCIVCLIYPIVFVLFLNFTSVYLSNFLTIITFYSKYVTLSLCSWSSIVFLIYFSFIHGHYLSFTISLGYSFNFLFTFFYSNYFLFVFIVIQFLDFPYVFFYSNSLF